MLSKVNVWRLVQRHLKTLHHHGSTHISAVDIFLFYGSPTLIAGGLVYWPGSVQVHDTASLLAVTGILFGFLATIYFFVIERLIANQNRTVIQRELLDQALSNVGYATLVLLFLLVLLSIPAMFGTSPAPVASTNTPAEVAVPDWISAVFLALAIHFILTMLMVLKRIDRVAHDEAD